MFTKLTPPNITSLSFNNCLFSSVFSLVIKNIDEDGSL